MMATPRKISALAGIFDDEPEAATPHAAIQPDPPPVTTTLSAALSTRRRSAAAVRSKGSSHPGKKPVLIHIPEDMHRTLRQLSVEEGGEPLTVITERLLRQYLVQRGHTRFTP